MTYHYIAQVGDIWDNACKFRTCPYGTINPSIDHPLPRDTEVVLCAEFCTNDHRLQWEALPNVLPLGDPLKNQAIKAPAATKLTSWDVQVGSNLWDVLDILKGKNKSLEFRY